MNLPHRTSNIIFRKVDNHRASEEAQRKRLSRRIHFEGARKSKSGSVACAFPKQVRHDSTNGAVLDWRRCSVPSICARYHFHSPSPNQHHRHSLPALQLARNHWCLFDNCSESSPADRSLAAPVSPSPPPRRPPTIRPWQLFPPKDTRYSILWGASRCFRCLKNTLLVP